MQINHRDMVKRLAKPGSAILETLVYTEVEALKAALSISHMLGMLFEELIENEPLKTGNEAHIFHMVVGMIGETGELVDCIKKKVIYNKPIDLKNLAEELGDLEFYLEGFIQADLNELTIEFATNFIGHIHKRMEFIGGIFGVTRDQWIQGNIDKLSERYKGLVYSDKAAQERADKVE